MAIATKTVRLSTKRLEGAGKVLAGLGLDHRSAIEMFLAQVERRKGIPFAVTLEPEPLLSAAEQAAVWTKSLDAY